METKYILLAAGMIILIFVIGYFLMISEKTKILRENLQVGSNVRVYVNNESWPGEVTEVKGDWIRVSVALPDGIHSYIYHRDDIYL